MNPDGEDDMVPGPMDTVIDALSKDKSMNAMLSAKAKFVFKADNALLYVIIRVYIFFFGHAQFRSTTHLFLGTSPELATMRSDCRGVQK